MKHCMDNWISQIYPVEESGGNRIFIMRDDLLPYSFGGNKARKARLFFEEIDAGGYDAVVTYGSGGSNHCRVIANLAAQRNMTCVVVSADRDSDCINRRLLQQFGAQVRACPVEQVSATIDAVLAQLRTAGRKPFFIPGGGHGNTGTRAYDLAYDEIKGFQQRQNMTFDYIFFASGTGTTHAGLLCGKKRWGDTHTQIVGISIARSNPRGGQVVADSVRAYAGDCPEEDLHFLDEYICGGYGKYDAFVEETIRRMMRQHGIPLDPTYTGKAYAGMLRWLKENHISGKRILFIHTGGTPLFCDWVREQ